MSVLRFATGVVVGSITSFSISVGLVPVVVVFAAILFVGIATLRSAAFLSGSLIGWGGTWVVLSWKTYAGCISRAPDCDPGVALMPFVGVAAAICLVGVGVGIIGFARSRRPVRVQQS